MPDISLARRTLLRLLGGSLAAGVAGCGAAETPREGLARVFGLAAGEQRWLDALSAAEQRELYDLVSNPESVANRRAVSLIAKLLGPRSRLFGFVRYPAVQDKRSLCDGLVRE
jgi:hypothetical protein